MTKQVETATALWQAAKETIEFFDEVVPDFEIPLELWSGVRKRLNDAAEAFNASEKVSGTVVSSAVNDNLLQRLATAVDFHVAKASLPEDVRELLSLALAATDADNKKE